MGSLFSSPQTTYQTPPLPSYLQNYLQTAGNWLQGQVGAPTPYPGPFTADISPWTSQAITNLTAQAQAAAPMFNIGAGQTGATAAGQYLPTNNPYVQAIAQSMAATGQQQMQQLNQQQQQQFAQMGLGNSTPLMETQARIAGQVIPQEVGQIGGTLSAAYEAERARQVQAAQQAMSVPQETATAQYQAGLLPQQTLQNLYTAQYQDFARQIEQMQAAAGGFPGLSAYLQQPKQVQYGQPPITGLLTGAAQLFGGPVGGLAGNLFNKGGNTANPTANVGTGSTYGTIGGFGPSGFGTFPGQGG